MNNFQLVALKAFLFLLTIFWCHSAFSLGDLKAPGDPEFPKHKIGYSLSINKITDETLSYAKSVGVDYIEVSGMTSFFNSEGKLKKTEDELEELFTKAKEKLDRSGIKVWSIHMAFGKEVDISLYDDKKINDIIERHLTVLNYVKLLNPRYILFHPSYYIEKGKREAHKEQLQNSVELLNQEVNDIGSTLVIENMLGPELMKGEVERPLMRTIEETQELFEGFPENVGLAIDMNHIKNPENLIRAMGHRLKTVHVADGSGEAENHYMPCSGLGKNNWNEVFKALYEVEYKGVFLYESPKYDDEKEFKECYDTLYQNFRDSLK